MRPEADGIPATSQSFPRQRPGVRALGVRNISARHSFGILIRLIISEPEKANISTRG